MARFITLVDSDLCWQVSVQHLEQVKLLNPVQQHRVTDEVYISFVANTVAVTALMFDIWASKGWVVEFAAPVTNVVFDSTGCMSYRNV